MSKEDHLGKTRPEKAVGSSHSVTQVDSTQRSTFVTSNNKKKSFMAQRMPKESRILEHRKAKVVWL